jgi:L1 cell adhesion molecule like protein
MDANCFFCNKIVFKKYKIDIQSKKDEYSCLISLANDVLKSQGIDIASLLHELLLNQVTCLQCYRLLKKFADATSGIQHIKQKIESCFDSQNYSSKVLQTPLSHITPKKRKLPFDISSQESSAKSAKRQCYRESPLFKAACKKISKELMYKQCKSPNVAVVVGYQGKPKIKELSASLKRIGKSITRQSGLAIAKSVVKNEHLNGHVVRLISLQIRKEMQTLTSRKHDSILRMKNKQSLENFTWDRVWNEIERFCPTLANVLKDCLPPKLLVKDAFIPSVALCSSVLFKLRNPHVNVLQGVISILLKAGHANSQVFRRLAKMSLCLSYRSTLNVMDVISEGFDEEVDAWKVILQDQITHQQPPSHFVALLPNIPYLPPLSPSSVSVISSSESIMVNDQPLNSPEPITPAFSPITSSCHSESSNFDTQDYVTLIESIDSGNYACGFSTNWSGFTIVGDNLDRNIRPRHQSLDSRTVSLHFFNSYAAKDRIDLSSFENTEVSFDDMRSYNIEKLLISTNDINSILKNASIIIGRLFVKLVPGFSKFDFLVKQHIKHQYSTEMSQKSHVVSTKCNMFMYNDKTEQVPLGIIMKNEMKTEEMVNILETLHQYVPSISSNKLIFAPGNSVPDEIKHDEFHKIGLQLYTVHVYTIQGDQLTIERIRSAQGIRANSENATKKLNGFIPMITDWHAKVSFLGVS